jgi:hypothetical protein
MSPSPRLVLPSSRRAPALLLLAAAAFLLPVLLAPAPGAAHQTITLYEYWGQHPVPDALGRWCEEEGLHVHSYRLDPDEYVVYELDGVIYFVGDPLFWGWRGSVSWYYDPHPIPQFHNGWCVLEGPHSHFWGPAAGGSVWASHDGYWVYTGAWDNWFYWYWDSWHSHHWYVHTTHVYRHHHYHPARHYVDRDYVRPRYDGRHRDSVEHRGSRGGGTVYSRDSDHRSSDDGDRYRSADSRDSGTSSSSSSGTREGALREAPEPRDTTWEGRSRSDESKPSYDRRDDRVQSYDSERSSGRSSSGSYERSSSGSYGRSSGSSTYYGGSSGKSGDQRSSGSYDRGSSGSSSSSSRGDSRSSSRSSSSSSSSSSSGSRGSSGEKRGDSRGSSGGGKGSSSEGRSGGKGK